ncbi:hypothetical protein NONO_c23040 [Nocardia nova SH22a]|uniref:DUF6879 domain-containing protein n=1 Tax=Nocardia nova SH22a TaxID=1415166 RepID=W5TCN6_9NOCA|nr:DUF6879 family protein [Nocardia nova]AHH17100.1 hypothetical protein NONO_c23040 [Nocardia nova SH22a]
MLHVVGDGIFEPLFRAARHRAFHLEVRDSYGVADEVEALRRWETGQTYEPEEQPASWKAWDDLMVETAARGVTLERLRVVTVPHSTYTRWLISRTDIRIETGEAVRWLPRHLTEPDSVPGDDYWLFDDHTVAFTTFAADDSFMGLSITTDVGIVGRCVEARTALWSQGIDHAIYLESEYARA